MTMKRHANERGREGPPSPPPLRCDRCIELDAGNFEDAIAAGSAGRPPAPSAAAGTAREEEEEEEEEDDDDDDGLLVEFYSPWCGGCRDFAPTLDRIADHLSVHRPGLRVARFDVSRDDVPRLGGEEVFRVEGTPTLYRVRRSPSFRAEPYAGAHDFGSILGWLMAADTPLG